MADFINKLEDEKMFKVKYKVILQGYETEIWALCKDKAIILAQAEAIQDGRNYKFVSIERD